MVHILYQYDLRVLREKKSLLNATATWHDNVLYSLLFLFTIYFIFVIIVAVVLLGYVFATSKCTLLGLP